MNLRPLCIISGIALLLGIFLTLPYNYFILLRWLIFISSFVVAYRFYKSKQTGWLLAFGAIGLLFNPIFPVYLSRSTWIPIDLISAILFFISSQSIRK